MTQDSEQARMEIAVLRAACRTAAQEIDAHLTIMDGQARALRRTRTAMTYLANHGTYPPHPHAAIIPMKPGMTPRDNGSD